MKRQLTRSRRAIGTRVQIHGGMQQFVGQTGEITNNSETDGPTTMYRVRLDKPITIEGLGEVTDDLWAGNLLRTIKPRRPEIECRCGGTISQSSGECNSCDDADAVL